MAQGALDEPTIHPHSLFGGRKRTAAPIGPTTVVVTSFAQESPLRTNCNCTLGEAIIAADTQEAVDGCPACGHTSTPRERQKSPPIIFMLTVSPV